MACEDSVRPPDGLDPRHLLGRWALVAGSLSHPWLLKRLKQQDSYSVNFSRNTSDNTISHDGTCMYRSFNISLAGDHITFGTPERNATVNIVRTSCRDCMLIHIKSVSGKRQHFYLFSRRREVEQEELEEFRAQVECLNMPPPVVMDPTKELCPEEKVEEKLERP